MKVPNSTYTEQPWRVHEFTDDFEIEDVWLLPTPGGPDGLDRLVRQFTSDDDDEISGAVIRALFKLRWKLGGLLGLDKEDGGLGSRVKSLRERLPDDLRDGPRGPEFQVVPFHSVYQTEREFVAEMANRTVHTLMHLGWVEDGKGGYQGQMTVLVKPNGAFGKAYMTAIKPFRRTLVVPELVRSIGRNWPKYA
jgi:hypothetical protein